MRRSTLLLAAFQLVLLGAMAATSLLVEPPPVRTTGEPAQFDAKRAKARLAGILGDQRPHPADTVADDAIRNRLLGQLRQMGLQPIVRDQFACNELYKQRGVSCARVHNVIAVLGPPDGKAVLLNAHYDSTRVGPGAADDGIGVAALLEVAGRLKDQPLKRPIILLFNEGEELGLIGARAFLADPLSRNVDSLVNLEARGVRGPVNMFETSRPNGAAVDLFARTAARPVANSLSTDVYRLLPNYTDVNSFAERGWLTLNFAPIGNETRYHSPGDELAALDLRTVQHMGDQALALALGLASEQVRPEPGDRIFMDLAGRILVVLPSFVGIALLIGLLAAFAWLAWKRGGLARGAGVALGTLLGSAASAWLIFAAIGAFRAGDYWRAEPLWSHLAAYAAALLAGSVLLAILRGRLDRTQLRTSFWLVFLVVGGAIGLVAPGGIIFFLLPPLLVLIGTLASRRWKQAERIAAIIAILFLYVTWGSLLGLLGELLSDGPMWLFAPLGALILLPALIEARPLIIGAGPRATAALSGVLLAALSIATVAAPAYSPDRQQRFSIQSVAVPPFAKSFWAIANDGAPLPSAMRRLAAWRLAKIPLTEREAWLSPAPPAPAVHLPTIRVAGVQTSPKERRVTFRVAANGALTFSLSAPSGSKIRTAGANGFVRPIDPRADSGRYTLRCFGRSCDGVTMEFTSAVRTPITFTVTALTPGLPDNARPLLAARPVNARPQYSPDSTLSISRVRL